ncbi:hypothetical protein E3N88_35308 [Mikania micrantha]|uniref:Uncharacterized protein n=1 Tax=Mikania micrantha TaxID=192012 RepID=A0A5N6M0Q2_9ASTR|nr:hypothetical protein E3N88_35308 [Mikania micrantha]
MRSISIRKINEYIPVSERAEVDGSGGSAADQNPWRAEVDARRVESNNRKEVGRGGSPKREETSYKRRADFQQANMNKQSTNSIFQA